MDANERSGCAINTQVDLECSPKTFYRVQADTEYGRKLVQQVRESMVDDFQPNEEFIFKIAAPGEVVVVPYNLNEMGVAQQHGILFDEMENADAAGDTSFNEEADGKLVWLEAPTKLFLMLLEKYQRQVGKKFELSSKKKMWRLISQTMQMHGYAFTEGQVQGKYRSLERQYKRVKLHNTKTGRNRLTCAHQTELDAVFGHRRRVFPEHTLDATQVESVSREEIIVAAGIGSEASDNSSQASTSGRAKKQNKNSHPAVVSKLGEIVKEKTKLVLEFLQTKEEQRREDKKERFERIYAQKEEHNRKKKNMPNRNCSCWNIF